MPFGLYLHFPFCRFECSYCDFYKELYSRSLEKQFYAALMVETELAAAEYESFDRQVSSIFIGGGTPSLTDTGLFAAWVAHLKKLFRVPHGVEFTVEFNPESATLESLTRLGEFGVNRPVFGIQSFDAQSLALLERRHNPHDSHRSVYYANALGFRNFGVDLMFGLPGQTSRSLSADLDQLLELDPPHVSFYQLTIEAGTDLAGRVATGKLHPPDTDLTMAMYRGSREQLAKAGYARYEVSSFARPGFECRHNLGYWEGRDYLGLGPSARSFMAGQRYANTGNLLAYVEQTNAGRLPRVIDQSGAREHMSEVIMLGLRTSRGVSRSQFSRRFGVPLESRLNREQYRQLVESGHLLPDHESIRLSDESIPAADEITRRLID